MTSRQPHGVVQLGPYPPPYGGVAANVLAIDKLLVDRGLDAAIVSIAGPRQTDRARVRFPSDGLALILTLLRLPHRIVHMHLGGDLKPKLLALVLATSLLPGRRTVVTLHSGGAAADPSRPGRRSLAGLVLRRVDRVIGVNPSMIDWFLELGCAPDRTHLILPYAIDADYLREAAAPLQGEMARFRERHDPLLVTVGGLEDEYDIPTQLEALRLVRERLPGAGLIVVGAGSLAADLHRRSEELGVAQQVLVTGALPPADTARAIRSADVFLRTTKYDGDSIAVREALHLGTPVVATDNGMRPPGTLLVPTGDPRAVADAIRSSLAGRVPHRQPWPPDTRGVEGVLDVYRSLGLS